MFFLSKLQTFLSKVPTVRLTSQDFVGATLLCFAVASLFFGGYLTGFSAVCRRQLDAQQLVHQQQLDEAKAAYKLGLDEVTAAFKLAMKKD